MTSLASANFIYGEELYLSAHYVKPESQHTGYGTALLNEGLSRFEIKFEGVYLEEIIKMKKQ